jgi:hypothetical protein
MQNSLEQIGDVKSIEAGDSSGFVSLVLLRPNIIKLTKRFTKPNSLTPGWLTKLSSSSTVSLLLAVDSR